MALQKFLALLNGRTVQTSPLQVSAGAASGGAVVALNNSGVIDSTMLPASSGVAAVSAVASEAISAGAIVNVWNNAGTVNLRNADNTAAGKEAHGFALAAIASGATGTATLQGINSSLSALTPGSYYFLGAVGAVTVTPPTTTGNINQLVGYATAATGLEFRPDAPVTV